MLSRLALDAVEMIPEVLYKVVVQILSKKVS